MTSPIDETKGLADQSHVLATCKCRVSIDISVELRDIDPSLVHSVVGRAANYPEIIGEEWVWESARFQRELLLGLLKHPDILKRLLRHYALSEAGECAMAFNSSGKSDLEPDWVPEEKLTAPVRAKLSKPAQEYFRDAIKNGVFAEATDHLFEVIRASVDEVSLTETTIKIEDQ